MATYAKILKDTEGNQILPYTRSKLVYMEDGSTVQTAITNLQSKSGYTLPTASSSTLGGVKVGSNITISSGTISLNSSNIINALGYTPTNDESLKYYSVATETLAISSLGGGLRIFQQGAACYFFLYCTTIKDFIANSSTDFMRISRKGMPCPIETNSAYNQSNYLTKTGSLKFPMFWRNSSGSQCGNFYCTTTNSTNGSGGPYMDFYAYTNIAIPSGSTIYGSCSYMTQYYADYMSNKTPMNTFTFNNYVY